MIKKVFYFAFPVLIMTLAAEAILRMMIAIKLIPFVAGQAELLSSYQIMPMFNHPVATYDTTSGFRWVPGQHQSLKICKGKIVFYNDFKVNSSGFVSGFNYKNERNGKKKRYLVFGDSFTDGYFLKENWPSRCNRMLRKNQIDVELYNYALNGNGLLAWSRLLRQLQQDSMTYDGIILAVFANDLQRELFVWKTDSEKSCFGWVKAQDLPAKNLTCLNNIKAPKGLQQLLFELKKGPQSLWNEGMLLPIYAAGAYKMVFDGLNLRREQKKLSETFIWKEEFRIADIDNSYFQKKYGAEKTDPLMDLLEQCNKQGKEIILAAVPEEAGLQLTKQNIRTIPASEMQYLCRKFGTKFVDGYQLLSEEGLPEDYFLPNDGHWNQKGSDYFAEGMYRILSASNKIYENADPVRREK